jgi:FkbM family methyltransferase
VSRLRRKLEPEMGILEHLVAPDGVAVDVGANNGLYTYSLVSLCTHVHAFEPLPMCQEVIAAWGHERVTLHRVALSDHQGELELRIPLIDGVPSTGWATFGPLDCEHQNISVPVMPLDALDLDRVSFVKIDVEGHESSVIAGARATLERDRPVLLVEIEQDHIGERPIGSVFDSITEIGYDGYFISGDRFAALSEFDLERDQDHGAGGPYVNNFVFVPTGDDRLSALRF